jgi:hypothetical protein
MPRMCSVCTHPARLTIEDRLEAGQYSLSKSSLDRHKAGHLPTHLAQDGADLQAEFQAARQADRWHYTQLRRTARAVMRAMQGWGQIQSPEEWQQGCDTVHKAYASGGFIIKRLGGQRFLDPETVAVRSPRRQGLMDQYGAESPAATMLIDLAVMADYNALRIQGAIGDLALSIEHECFAAEAPKVKLQGQYGSQIEGFAGEDHLRRLRDQFLPSCERANRQRLQHLQALQRGRPGASPMVAIGQARHVNAAQQQLSLQRREGRSSQPIEPC